MIKASHMYPHRVDDRIADRLVPDLAGRDDAADRSVEPHGGLRSSSPQFQQTAVRTAVGVGKIVAPRISPVASTRVQGFKVGGGGEAQKGLGVRRKCSPSTPL